MPASSHDDDQPGQEPVASQSPSETPPTSPDGAPSVPPDDAGQTAPGLPRPAPRGESRGSQPEEVDSGGGLEEPSPPATEPESQADEQARGGAEPGGEDSLTEVSRRLQSMEGMLERRLGALENAADRLAADADQRDEQRRNREALYEKLDASRSTFQFQLLRPIVQRLALLYDLLAEFLTHLPSDPKSVEDALKMLSNHLRDTMIIHGIEMVQPEVGDAFDSRVHYIMAKEPTAAPERHGRIAGVLMHGFVYFGQHERTGDLRPAVVRPARVVVWDLQQEDAQTEDGTPAEPTDTPTTDDTE